MTHAEQMYAAAWSSWLLAIATGFDGMAGLEAEMEVQRKAAGQDEDPSVGS